MNNKATKWFVIAAECKSSGDVYQSTTIATCYDEAIDEFMHIRPSATCINIDRYTPDTAKDYGVPYLLEKKNYVNLNCPDAAEY